jgi:hypothetical protein
LRYPMNDVQASLLERFVLLIVLLKTSYACMKYEYRPELVLFPWRNSSAAYRHGLS